MKHYLLLASLVVLTACAAPEPPTMEEAMLECTERARKAVSPDVSGRVSINSRGEISTGIGISISGDQLAGRNPVEVYEACVISKTGQAPTKQLEL